MRLALGLFVLFRGHSMAMRGLGHLLLSAALFAQAQAQNVTTRLYTTTDGLMDRVVTDVHRDADGFLWILGQHGLQRFDGHRFEVFNHLIPDSLQRSLIGVPNFHADPDGWIWLVDPAGRHALRFDPVTMAREVHTPPIVLPTAPDLVRLCTQLYPYYDVLAPLGSPDEVRKRMTGLLADTRIRAMQRTPDGRVWVYGDHGRSACIDPRTGARLEPTGPVIPRRTFWPMLDTAAVLWLPDVNGTIRGLQLPRSIMACAELSPHLDQRGGLWLQAEGNLLYEVDPATGGFTDHGALVAGVMRVYRDEEDLVWLCTDAGLVRQCTRPSLFTPYGAKPVKEGGSMVGNSVRGIVELRGGGLLAFNDIGQLLRIDTADGSVRPWANGPGALPDALGLLRSAKGTVWMLSAEGMHRLNDETSAFDAARAPPEARILSMFVDASGERFLLFLDNGRACLFFPDEARFGKTFPLAKAPRAAVLFTGHQVLLPDDKGLRLLDTRTFNLRTIDLKLPRPLLENGVRGSVHVSGLLHMATDQGIISVDTATWSVVRQVSEAEGLSDPVVYSLLCDGERLWAGTRNGLSMVDPATGACINFHVSDGLPANEFNTGATLLDSRGRCWMGGVNGFARFDPRAIGAIPRDPARLRVVHVRSSDERATAWTDHLTPGHDVMQGITLQPTERSLSLGFTLSSLERPENHRYTYYLEGLEPAWQHTGSVAEATYHGLPPGRYRFRVKAFDHRGVAAINELEVPITVLQVWYLRTWAIVLWSVLVIGAALLIMLNIVRRRAERAEAERIRELDAFKDRFFANVTHEFRTPLTVILGVAGQLERSANGDATTAGQAGLILRNSKRLLALVDQVLDLTRLRYGRLVLDVRPVDLQAFLHRTMAMHRSHADVRRVELRTEVNGGPCIALFDAERLRQVIDNLCGNAIKFTPAGGSVHVRADVVPGPTCSLRLTVRDTGPGIDADDLPRIFDRFHQGREGAVTSGTGIGLALAKELVEAMGGRIAVESAPGQGSTFTLRVDLPRTEATVPNEAGAAAVEAEPPATERRPAVKNAHVDTPNSEDDRPLLLVVEDDPDVAQYICGCLGPSYRVLHAVDGDRGLAMAREHVPDLVLSDVMMPGMDGFALCHALKTDPATSHIPVALLTARSDQPARLEGITRGADAYLVKPFDEQELIGVLRNLHRLQLRIQERTRQRWQEAPPPPPAPGTPVPPPPPPEEEQEHRFMVRVRDLLEAHHADPGFGVEELADKLGLSRSQVFRKVKALTGETPVALLRNCRLTRARTLLAQGGYTVSEVAFACGFSSASYFSDVYLAVFGHRPSEQVSA